MHLPASAHTSHPWRIHELVKDFRIEDVWALPTPGGPDDFPHLVRQFSSGGPQKSAPTAAAIPRLLFAIRWKLGSLLGWDKPEAGIGARVRTLRDRLPADLRDGPRGPDLRTLPMASVYQTANEWALEIANKTVHGVMHIGWVVDDQGSYRGQMAVLVKPNGIFGQLYMALIRPFRHLGLYSAMFKAMGREWQKNPQRQSME